MIYEVKKQNKKNNTEIQKHTNTITKLTDKRWRSKQMKAKQS